MSDRFVGEADSIEPMGMATTEDNTTTENKRRAERVRAIMAGESPVDTAHDKLHAASVKMDSIVRRIDSLS